MCLGISFDFFASQWYPRKDKRIEIRNRFNFGRKLEFCRMYESENESLIKLLKKSRNWFPQFLTFIVFFIPSTAFLRIFYHYWGSCHITEHRFLCPGVSITSENPDDVIQFHGATTVKFARNEWKTTKLRIVCCHELLSRRFVDRHAHPHGRHSSF